MNADTETNVDVARVARREADRATARSSWSAPSIPARAPRSRRSPSRRAFPTSSTSPPPRRSPSRATSSCSATSRPRPMILGDAFANQKEIFAAAGSAPKTVVFMHVNDTFGTAMKERHRRGDAEVRHAVQDRRDDRLRSGGARSVGRSLQGQGDRRRRAAGGQPPQRRDPAHARNGQAALDADGDAQHGAGLVRGPVSQDARQALRRAAELRALVRSEQEAEQGARGRARQGVSRASTSTPTTSIRSRRCWSPPTPTSAPARPIRRRWPTPSARPTSPTTSASARASSSTPRARTTS